MRYTMAITVRLEEEVLEKLRMRAAKEERSVGSLIRIAVREMLKDEQRAKGYFSPRSRSQEPSDIIWNSVLSPVPAHLSSLPAASRSHIPNAPESL